MTEDCISTSRSAWGLDNGGEGLRWWHRALCREVGGELFFVDPGESTAPAKAVCGLCEVRTACLEDALAYGDRYGVRGGLSERDRASLRRGQPLVPCGVCGTEFVPRAEGEGGKLRRYCSDGCRRAAHRKAVRESDRRRSAA